MSEPNGPGPLARLWMGALRDANTLEDLEGIWGLANHPKTCVWQHLTDPERECLTLARDKRKEQLLDLEPAE